MFEKLVVSTNQRPKHTTAKFFAGTVLLYAIVLACAIIVSVVVSDPKLADTFNVIALAGPPPMSGSTTPKPPASNRPPRTDVAPDPNHPMTLEQIMGHRDNHPPVIPVLDRFPGGSGSSIPGGTDEAGIGIGVPDGDLSAAPPPRPDPLPVKPAATTTVPDTRPVRVTSNVLQGKAIERRVPVYPELVRRIHLQGDVAVEVIISPEGRVESARAISGHPMLVATALEAARGWRFGPTILNGVPVRVTGVITFVFKLTE
ncbi:MAG TPA: energy transducer TonB [Blastocatellia bacterium]|nr:energy transducer TonB [Blastocatellia bacterium]